MRQFRATVLVSALGMAFATQALAVTLTGTIRDFCVPTVAGCTYLSDFEGGISGLVSGMVGSTLVGGLPSAAGAIGTGGSSSSNFAKWYTDSPGFNVSTPHSIVLTEGPSGTFKFSSSAFFPIDGMLYGNQGESHNYHFTMHLEGLLSFSDPTPGAADKSFSFTGDDDLWIFVDGKLAIDLGGVHGALSDSFTEEDLKALGLTAGTSYDLDIFFAERHTSESNFNITTTLDIAAPPPSGVPEPGSLSLLGLGLAGLGALTRRRRV